MPARTSGAIAAQEVVYEAYGAAWDALDYDGPEIVLSGPAGTGKSRACLEKLNYIAETWPGVRLLMVRKTRRSLTESGMVTFEHKVLLPSQRVHFHNSSQQYRYPNGSIIAVAGLDKPGKIMSSEWDMAYVQEATELTEHDWEALSTRLRNGKGPYHQLLGDCNPDAPTHWLRLRANGGRVRMLESRHEDNPTVTPEYLARLDALTGVRRERLRYGRWVAAEGMIYADAWQRDRNIVPRAKVATRTDLYGDCGVPRTWPRFVGVDFGFTHPFVAKWYACDGDGRLWMYRELYMTHRLVEDHARDMLRICGWELRGGRPFPTSAKSDVLPYAVVCDHDAEDRHTLTRHTGLPTIAAYKDVSAGIQAVAARFRAAGDGKPRLAYLEDSLVERDAWLVDHKLPTCSAEEVESYVWDISAGKRRGEQPVKDHDHGMDVDRYIVAARDLRDMDVSFVRNAW